MLQMNSCQSVKHQNFNRQKYLKGKIKPAYDEEESASQKTLFAETPEINTTTANTSENLLADETPPIFSDEAALANETGSPPEVEPKIIPAIRQEPRLNDLPKKKLLSKSIKPYTSRGPDMDVGVTWFIILLCLALIALPFAFLIGFWAFIISGVLLLLAGIVLFTTDQGSGFLENMVWLIIMLSFLVLLGLAIVIALVAFIVWGIIQLFN